MTWGNEIEVETRNRIRLSIAAYAYECLNESFLTDAEYDMLAYKIDPTISTGNETLDSFFREEFSPHTGQWIHNHPEQDKLHNLYVKYYKDKN